MPARSIEQIRNLCKRRGFIFPGSAAYGGLGSFWDYGPLGVEMLNHIKRAWWKAVVYERDDMEGLDSAIITSRKVWQHSGHEATFSDPLVDNKETKKRYRLDHLLSAQPDRTLGKLVDLIGAELRLASHRSLPSDEISPGKHMLSTRVSGSEVYWLRVLSEAHTHFLKRREQTSSPPFPERDALVGYVALLLLEIEEPRDLLERALVVAPEEPGKVSWTLPRRFNLMFQSHVGAIEAEPDSREELASRVYLRPETAQGIFMNFKHVQTALRRKLPFGVAQIGKAFRNEITPGNFIFRTREFEQMEIEFFIKPPQFAQAGEKSDEQWHAEWIDQRFNWWLALGVDASRLRKRAQDKAELAHYAKATTDLEYIFPDFGWGEVEGIANRTDFDLSAHSREVPDEALQRLKLEKNADSTETLDYFDPDAKQRYIPWVIEPSAGVTRAMLTFLCEAYHEELVKQPEAAEVAALQTEIDAAIKNAHKKIKESTRPAKAGPSEGSASGLESASPANAKAANAEPPKHDPAQITDFVTKLEEMKQRLPASLLEIDNLIEDHPGAQNLEPVKKLKPKVNKLAEDCVRVVLRLHPALAPVKVAIFPLKKNAPEIVDIAQRITSQLRAFMRVQYDDSAGIGRLYRRQDEIGTPFCITVDFDTLEDNTVTLRERDTMQQTRVKIDELKHMLMQRLHLA